MEDPSASSSENNSTIFLNSDNGNIEYPELLNCYTTTIPTMTQSSPLTCDFSGKLSRVCNVNNCNEENENVSRALSVLNLSARLQPSSFFRNGKESSTKLILNDISFIAYPGEILLIMGSSGSGKSTILNCITSRFPGVMSSSTQVCYGSKKLSSYEMRKNLRYINTSRSFLPHLTVFETMMFSADLNLANQSKMSRINFVADILEEVSLTSVSHVKIGALQDSQHTQGELARLTIGLELIENNSILILDEPTRCLDHYLGLEIMSILKNLAKQGKTIILTLHQPSSHMFNMCDRLLLANEGRVVYHGPTNTVVPYFNKLGFQIHRDCAVPDFCLFVMSTHIKDEASLNLYSYDDYTVMTENESTDYISSSLVGSIQQKNNYLADIWQLTEENKQVYNEIQYQKNLPYVELSSNTKKNTNPFFFWFYQVYIIFCRNLKNSVANKFMFLSLLCIFIAQALILGGIFFGKAATPTMPVEGKILTEFDIAEFINITDQVNSMKSSFDNFLNLYEKKKNDAISNTDITRYPKMNDLLFSRFVVNQNINMLSCLSFNLMSSKVSSNFYNVDVDIKKVLKMWSLTPYDNVTSLFDQIKFDSTNLVSETLRVMYLYLMRGIELLDNTVTNPNIQKLLSQIQIKPVVHSGNDIHSIEKIIQRNNPLLYKLSYKLYNLFDDSFFSTESYEDETSITSQTASYMTSIPNALMVFSNLFNQLTPAVSCYHENTHYKIHPFIKREPKLFERYSFSLDTKPVTPVANNSFSSEFKKKCEPILKSSFDNYFLKEAGVDKFIVTMSYYVCFFQNAKHPFLNNIYTKMISYGQMLIDILAIFKVKYTLPSYNFLMSIVIGLCAFPILITYVMQRSVYNVELINSLYSRSAFFFAANLSDSVLYFLPIVCFSSIFYMMLGFNSDIITYLSYVAISLLIMFSASGFFFINAIISPNLSSSFTFTVFFLVQFIALSGYLIKDQHMSPYVSWLKYLSFCRWGFFAYNMATLPTYYEDTTGFLRSSIINRNVLIFINDQTSYIMNIVFLVVLGLIYRLVAFILFHFVNTHQGVQG